jgi:hypothetical protein
MRKLHIASGRGQQNGEKLNLLSAEFFAVIATRKSLRVNTQREHLHGVQN